MVISILQEGLQPNFSQHLPFYLLIQIYNWKSTAINRLMRNLFMAVLFILRISVSRLLRGSCQRNIFFFFILFYVSKLGVKLWPNVYKVNILLLDYGDYLVPTVILILYNFCFLNSFYSFKSDAFSIRNLKKSVFEVSMLNWMNNNNNIGSYNWGFRILTFVDVISIK